jgi:hypothetical protein
MKSGTSVGNTDRSKRKGSRTGIADGGASVKAATQEDIRTRAYEIHLERGGIHGCDLDDWLQAERELQEKYKNIETGPNN